MKISKPQTLLFFGLSGAGKGTQVKMISQFLEGNSDFKTINMEMGALLRNMIARGGYTGELIDEIVSNGKLMPGFLPNYLMTKQLVENFTGNEHIVADAVVRRVSQAEAFDDAMEFYGRGDYAVINIKVSEETAFNRLMGRGRSDDTEEKILRRLNWYEKEVLPSLEVFRNRKRNIVEIDGERSIDEIHKDILNKLCLK